MHFRQFYLACLAHASYLIAEKGEAAVVDLSVMLISMSMPRNDWACASST